MAATFKEIVEKAKNAGPKRRLAVPAPKKSDIDLISCAAGEGLIIPLLIGEGKTMEALAKKSPLASLEYEIVEVGAADGAILKAVSLAREGRADIVMQGGVDQKSFMNSVLEAKTGLLKSRVASYASVFQLRKRDKLILATDTFVNNFPGIAEKQLILENALGLAGVLEIEEPRVAALAAIEQVNPSIPSTLDAAILSKMSERKQFGKAVVEGPLDMDCALSEAAAARKGLKSAVTGNADIYLVPEIETGYQLVQALVFFGGMKTAGIILGTAVPAIPILPFVANEDRIVELALAVLLSGIGGNHG